MSHPIRLLLVEDSEDDAELLLRALRQGGYSVEYRRVDSGPDLASALIHETWDIVITDHNLPGFNSQAVLTAVKNSHLDLPVIIVSGSIGETIAVEAMKNGASDYIMKNNLARLVPAISRELRENKARIEHRRAQDVIRHLAYHDPLTGLANRHEFESRLQLALSSVDSHTHHALLYMDLDQFKIVNDTCGHEAGDELLRQLSQVLRAPIRDADTLARLGGDEFGILLLQCPVEHALQVAERMLLLTRNFRYAWKDKSFSVGASIGLVMLEDQNQTLSDALRIADMACYAAKEKGRDRMHIYRADDAELLQRHGEMQWVERINSALAENRFELFHQLIVPLGTNNATHCEFLLRMLDDKGKHIMPGTFIPAAERYNLMPSLDRWVVHNAFAFLSQASNQQGNPIADMFFINLSGASVGDDKFTAYVTEQLLLHNLQPSMIGFEITETAVIANLHSAVSFIKQVRQLGAHVALDDFGAGLSTFSYLKQIPADYLKIDGSFVRNMLDDPMDHAIVDAINRVGHVAGLKTIAEFVESDAIRQRLAEIGVDYAQGYAIGRPAPLPGNIKNTRISKSN
jgi:diguanylate cyclase (GGDEF)-like protein